MHNPLLTSRALLTKACLITVGVGLLGLAPGANARVTQLHITQTETPAYAGAEFGSVGQYERIDGTITGEVDPKDPLNAVIVDIDRAPKHANGTVGYTATFQILRPVDLTKGNHRVISNCPTAAEPMFSVFLMTAGRRTRQRARATRETLF